VLVVTDLQQCPWEGERAVITIGAYDGVHSGHRAVIDQVRRRANDLGAKSVVVSFDRHPASVVRPESAPRLLTSPDLKMELLADTGIDAVVIVPFDTEQAAESPESFVDRVLVRCLRTALIVVGEDFHFGRHRDGNVDLLRKIGVEEDFDVEPVQLVPRMDGVAEPVSSTAIRRALAGGDIGRANSMLGRPHEVRGEVFPGDQRGRLADASLLEAHLLDVDIDLYGETATVRFEHFLRSERKFDGVDALIEQLGHDVAHARDLLA